MLHPLRAGRVRPPPLPRSNPAVDPLLDSIAPPRLVSETRGAQRSRLVACFLGATVGALAALVLLPVDPPASERGATIARAEPRMGEVDGGVPDAGLPDAGIGQEARLIAIVGDVRWGPPRAYPAFDRKSAVRAIESATAGVAQRCALTPSEARAPAAVTFAPSGVAVRGLALGPLLQSERRACVERALEQAQVEPFSGARRHVRLTLDLR